MTSFRWFGSSERDMVQQKPHKKMLARKTRPRRLFVEALEARNLLATFMVLNTNDSGAGSLRQAISDANNHANVGGPDTILFNIPGIGVHTISPTLPLPTITEAAVIDGYSQPGSSANTSSTGDNAILQIELNGQFAGGGVNGLTIMTVGCTIQGLVINRFEGSGILISGQPVTGNTVSGNFIGSNPAGTAVSRNLGDGVWIKDGAVLNTIGGNVPASRNLISGDGNNGIEISGVLTMNNWVAGNLIGTDVTGTVALPGGSFSGNGSSGIYAHGQTSNNLIGTNADGVNDDTERNVISGNSLEGVNIAAANMMIVAGNYIGVDITGTHAVANGFIAGIAISGAGNRIGTNGDGINDTAERNIISGNHGQGVWINNGPFSSDNLAGNTVAGNYIGLDKNGAAAVGNTADGVLIQHSAKNTIGGTTLEAGNTIAFNGMSGIGVTGPDSTRNQIRGNSVFSNVGLGIDLADDGVTLNDSKGHSGPNNYQNFPSFTQATATVNYLTSQTSITGGTLNSTPRATFALDFYASTNRDPSGYGEGQTYLGSAIVITDATGKATIDSGTFATPLAAAPCGEDEITATATDANGNTSEFSLALNATVIPGPARKFQVTGFPSPIAAGISGSFTVSVQDDCNNTVPTYTGTVTFTSSDGQAALPTDYTFTPSDGGVHTFSATLKTAGMQSITATDTVMPTITSSQTGITVNRAAASAFVVSGFPSPVTAGTQGTFTVTAKDLYNNTATGYVGTVQFTSSDGQAALPPPYTFMPGDSGARTFRATLKTAGTQSLTATDTVTGITGSELGIMINPPATLSGTVFQDININGKQDPGEPGIAGQTLFLDLSGSGKLETGDPTATTDSSGNYQFTISSAGTYTVRQVLFGGVLLGTPASGGYQVTLTSGLTVTGQNFAEVPTSIAVPLTLPLSSPFPKQGNANADFVEALYRAILNRDADPTGLAAWTSLLNKGAMSRLQVVQGIRQSREHFMQEVTDFYLTLLARTPDPNGLQAWVTKLENGQVTEEQVAFDFLDSPEYLGKGDKYFVDHMYLSLLGRTFDPAGEAQWLNALGDDASGNPTHPPSLTHEQVIRDFLYSRESLIRLVQGYYQVFLQRLADPSGLNSWLTLLEQGGSFLTIGQGFLSSPEFYNNAAAEG